ncbi:helix-turn-helix domain-containing protein [Streptomyces sp. NPDC003006]
MTVFRAVGQDADVPPVFAVAGDIALFGEARPYEVTRHRHPAWKLVLPLGGHAFVGESAGAGVLVPPQYTHACATTSAFVAVFIDPWCLRADPSAPTWLDGCAVRRLLDASDGGVGAGGAPDAEALRAEVASVAGPRTGVDPRVPYAVRAACANASRVDAVAAELGLSPARLRALVAAEVGIPLVTLRQWGRLRAAFGSLVGRGGAGGAKSIADAAADAGFADQAHLTRAARRFTGRTPGSLDRHPHPRPRRR